MILHLVQSGGPAGATGATPGDAGLVACAETVRALAGVEHHVLLVGGERAGRRAAMLGVGGERIAPPIGSLRLAGRTIGRWLSRAPADATVICWGEPLSRVFARASPGRSALHVDLDAGTARLGEGSTIPIPARLSPPKDAAGEHARVRAALDISDEELVLAMLDDPPGDAVGMIFVAGVLRVAGVRATIVFDRSGPEGDAAVRHAEEIGYLDRFIGVDAPAAWFLPAADIGVIGPRQDARHVVAGFGSMLNLHAAASRGIPTALPGDGITRFLLPGALHASLAASSRPTDLSRSVLPLVTDPAALGRAKRACAEWVGGGGATLGAVMGGCISRLGAGAGRGVAISL